MIQNESIHQLVFEKGFNDTLNVTLRIISEENVQSTIINNQTLFDYILLITPFLTFILGAYLTYRINIKLRNDAEKRELYDYEYSILNELLIINEIGMELEKVADNYLSLKKDPRFLKLSSKEIIVDFYNRYLTGQDVEIGSIEGRINELSNY